LIAGETIFQVKNKHKVSAGKPPQIDGNVKGKYHGYFENEHGEQAIFVYDRETKSGVVWLGDAGWEKPYKVIDGLAPELILSEQEGMWLQACWNAATAFEER
jgi:hypothetical protein